MKFFGWKKPALVPVALEAMPFGLWSLPHYGQRIVAPVVVQPHDRQEKRRIDALFFHHNPFCLAPWVIAMSLRHMTATAYRMLMNDLRGGFGSARGRSGAAVRAAKRRLGLPLDSSELLAEAEEKKKKDNVALETLVVLSLFAPSGASSLFGGISAFFKRRLTGRRLDRLKTAEISPQDDAPAPTAPSLTPPEVAAL